MYILVVPIVFALVVFLALVFAAFRCWRTALSLLFVAMVVSWYGEVFPLHPLSHMAFVKQRDEADMTSALRVLTYNVYATGPYFAPRKNNKDGNPEFVQWIESYHPDLVLLEEIQHSVQPYCVDTLATHFPYSSWNVRKKKAQGNGYDLALSRYPMHDFRRLEMPDDIYPDSVRKEHQYEDPLVQMFHLDAPGGETLVIQCHLKTNNYITIRQSVVADSTQTRWIDGWDEYMEGVRRGYDIRPREVAAIIRQVLEEEQWQGPIIIAGDMNDIGGSVAIRRLEQGLQLHDAWWKGGFGFGFTYDEHYMYLRLDHILYSDHFRLRSVHVDKSASFSDHRPLIGDLEYRQ